MVVGVVDLVLMVNGWVPCAQGVWNKGASGICANTMSNSRFARTMDISISPLRLNNRTGVRTVGIACIYERFDISTIQSRRQNKLPVHTDRDTKFRAHACSPLIHGIQRPNFAGVLTCTINIHSLHSRRVAMGGMCSM